MSLGGSGRADVRCAQDVSKDGRYDLRRLQGSPQVAPTTRQRDSDRALDAPMRPGAWATHGKQHQCEKRWGGSVYELAHERRMEIRAPIAARAQSRSSLARRYGSALALNVSPLPQSSIHRLLAVCDLRMSSDIMSGSWAEMQINCGKRCVRQAVEAKYKIAREPAPELPPQ